MTGGRSDAQAGGRAGGQAVMLPAFDVQRVRADFPILSRQVRGGRLAYLDSAATAQKPRAVVEALSRFYFESNSNVHRGVHLLAEEATLAFDAARERVRQCLNAGSA